LCVSTCVCVCVCVCVVIVSAWNRLRFCHFNIWFNYNISTCTYAFLSNLFHADPGHDSISFEELGWVQLQRKIILSSSRIFHERNSSQNNNARHTRCTFFSGRNKWWNIKGSCNPVVKINIFLVLLVASLKSKQVLIPCKHSQPSLIFSGEASVPECRQIWRTTVNHVALPRNFRVGWKYKPGKNSRLFNQNVE